MKNIEKVLGYTIDKDFIDNVVTKNYPFIRKKIKELPIVSHIFGKDKNEKAYVIIFYDDDIKKKFKIEGFLNKGSYNKTYQIKDKKKRKFVYRLKNDVVKDREEVMENFLQTFIHAYLSEYQKTYLKNETIIPIDYYGFNQRYKFCSTIVEKMDGTLFFILANNFIPFENKIIILVNCLYQIVQLLEQLQEDLKFVHNDLKSDNIFFKFVDSSLDPKKLFEINNLKFYLGDFDTSRMELYDLTLMCELDFIPNRNFSSKKDLFLFTNSLLYSFYDDRWMNSFFKNFPVIRNIVKDEKIFYDLYNYEDSKIDEIYKPTNFKKKLEKLFENILKERKDFNLYND